MAYSKQNFEDGTVLTANHLNHIEDGLEEIHNSFDGSGSIQTKHYADMSITSIKLADDAIWPRHISDLTWNEVDKRINAALGVIENGTY